MTRGILAAAFLASTALTGHSAFAQDTTTRLEQVTVETAPGDEAATGAVEGYVADATLTGSKTATPLNEIPQSVSVVGAAEFRERGATKADEALRYTAGVFAQPYGADSDTDWIFIRGFDATQTGVYLDGMPLFFNGYGSTLVDPFTLERIEVLKGAASVLYGGSNPGGLVNYVSKVANGKRIRSVETGVSTADEGTAWTAFDIGDAINDVASYRVTGHLEGQKQDDGFDDNFKGVISPSLRLDLNDSTKLTLLGNYTAVDETHIAGTWLPYEGTVTRAAFGRIDPDFNGSEPGSDYYTRTQFSFGYDLQHAFDNGWSLDHKSRFTHVNVGEQQVLGYGYYASATELGRGTFKERTSADTFVSDTSLTGTLATGALDHTLLAGTDYKFYRNRSASGYGSAGAIDVLNPVYGAAGETYAVGADTVLEQHQLGAYAQDQIRFGGGFIATFNGRYDQVWTDNNGTTSTDGALSGRAGLAYEFANGLTPYVSVASFFNPQIGTTFAGDAFEPETGVQYEAGLKYQPTFMNALITASVFDLTRQNVQTDDPVNAWQKIQTGEVRSRGIELEAKGEILDNLTATAAFTAYNLEITKDTVAANVGKVPLAAPEVQGALWLEYGFDETLFGGALDGVSIGGGLRYVGKTFADNANLYEVPDVTLVDAHLGYSRDNWGVDLNVTNLADTTYVAACNTSAYCYYGEGRTVMLRARATW
ncbi:TonB-dependent siderophore receptor [Roseibium aestuarii]|uniref:TonB-dependent siderophore receptor n=1 Tax=Roseibium aestuarii TaxID=2600299 RepID=A0ABW4JPJ9_9HYPH|nr:TonB-dependent siderophore receptor [Roseibium aestuarii]